MTKDSFIISIPDYVTYIKDTALYYRTVNKCSTYCVDKYYKENAFQIEGDYYNGEV